jgi:hypothetical protein
MLGAFFSWLETTAVARGIGESLPLTASLSAVHLLGFMLVLGGALLADLRLLGIVLPRWPAGEVAAPAARVILLGLVVSVSTGLLLFSSRAASVSASGTFQLKMSLLVAATLFHFTVLGGVASRSAPRPALLRSIGAAGLCLWMGLAFAGAAFILFE